MVRFYTYLTDRAQQNEQCLYISLPKENIHTALSYILHSRAFEKVQVARLSPVSLSVKNRCLIFIGFGYKKSLGSKVTYLHAH